MKINEEKLPNDTRAYFSGGCRLGKAEGGTCMIVISDTTPLISLMKIDQLNLLNHLFGEVQIPSAVFEELISNPRFSDESRQIRECPFIKK